MRWEGRLSPNLYIPFFNVSLPMSWPLYMVFAAFVIVGTVNAVNITDGLDGLSTSVTIPVALFFVSVATWWGYTQLGVFAGALLGGCWLSCSSTPTPPRCLWGHRLPVFGGRRGGAGLRL